MIRLARHSAALAKRNLIGVTRNPEALLDVTLQPIIFILLFTYVFGGAISGGSQHDYLQFLLPGIIAGAVLGDVVRYLVLIVVTLGFGYVIGFRAETDVFQVLAACVLAIGFALCLCWISVFIGMKARTPGAVQGILFLALFPLTFGASTFVPTDTLPNWLQTFTDVNPMTHLVDSLRGLLLGGLEASDVLWTVGWMGAIVALFVPLALRAYNRRA